MIYQVLYLVLCACLIWEVYRRSSKEFKNAPPSLSGRLPLIGHAWKVLGDRKRHVNFPLSYMRWECIVYTFLDILNTVKSISKEPLERGGVLTMYLGLRVMYVISDPDDCAKVANECLDKDYYYNFAKPLLGNGLTTAEVPLWKQHRKCISPAFQQKILNGFLVVFNRQARRLVNQLKPELKKGPFNHEKYIRLNSLESICMTAFGADVSELGGLHTKYLEGMNEVLDIITERFQKVWLHSDFFYKWSKLKRREDLLIKNIKEFTSTILAKRKAEIKETKTFTDKSGQFTPFMNLILELSGESGCYTDDDVLHEASTIVGGGYDTSASTVTLALMLLGTYPEVQKKAYQELKKVFDDSNRDVEKDDLQNLVYLEAVLKETIRLYPIGPIVSRYIDKDMQIKNYTLKAGHGIGMLFWAMHRHAIWGPDAEQFRPERWVDGSVPDNPNAFGGFSIGKRACIGKVYAMMSMKTVLSHLLRNYHITSDMSKLVLEIGGILRPASGQNISIEERREGSYLTEHASLIIGRVTPEQTNV